MGRCQQQQAGFTIIEVMIAIAIIAIALSAFCSSLSASQQIQQRTANESLALEEIQHQVEDIQIQSYGQPPNATFTVKGLTPQAGQAMVGTISITSQTTTPAAIVYLVTTMWQDLEGPASLKFTYVHTKR